VCLCPKRLLRLSCKVDEWKPLHVVAEIAVGLAVDEDERRHEHLQEKEAFRWDYMSMPVELG